MISVQSAKENERREIQLEKEEYRYRYEVAKIERDNNLTFSRFLRQVIDCEEEEEADWKIITLSKRRLEEEGPGNRSRIKDKKKKTSYGRWSFSSRSLQHRIGESLYLEPTLLSGVPSFYNALHVRRWRAAFQATMERVPQFVKVLDSTQTRPIYFGVNFVICGQLTHTLNQKGSNSYPCVGFHAS